MVATKGQMPDVSPSHLVVLHVVDQSQALLCPILSSTNTQAPQLPKKKNLKSVTSVSYASAIQHMHTHTHTEPHLKTCNPTYF